MSVGYNLEGIKQPPMQQFIDNMMNAGSQPKFAQYRDTLTRWLRQHRPENAALVNRIPAKLVQG